MTSKIKLLFFYGTKMNEESHYDIVECSMKEKTALASINYEYFIIDEAHRLKNDQAKFSI